MIKTTVLQFLLQCQQQQEEEANENLNNTFFTHVLF